MYIIFLLVLCIYNFEVDFLLLVYVCRYNYMLFIVINGEMNIFVNKNFKLMVFLMRWYFYFYLRDNDYRLED